MQHHAPEIHQTNMPMTNNANVSDASDVRQAMQLISVWAKGGTAEMYRRRGLVISRAQSLCYDSGFAVLMS